MALDGVEVLRERLELPRDAGVERRRVHVLDLLQRVGDEAAILGPGGGDGEPAVAGDHRGDPVVARRRERRVPEHLGVEVGVDVDEPGGDDLPGGLDDGGVRVLGDEVLADADDHAIGKRHVGTTAGGTGAVHDSSPTDHSDITHVIMFAPRSAAAGSRRCVRSRCPPG